MIATFEINVNATAEELHAVVGPIERAFAAALAVGRAEITRRGYTMSSASWCEPGRNSCHLFSQECGPTSTFDHPRMSVSICRDESGRVRGYAGRFGQICDLDPANQEAIGRIIDATA